MAATDPLYSTPDTPAVNPKGAIPPTPQLQNLADFVNRPEEYVANRPNLQYDFKAPAIASSQQKNTMQAIIADAHKQVNALPYNKYDTAPVEYDNALARMYHDPEFGYMPGRDNETLYDSNQKWYGDIARNTLGFASNLAGSFAQTLASTPTTIAGVVNWLNNGMDSASFTKVYDNPISRTISDWMDDMQDATYNYRGERERQLEKNPLLNMIPFYGNGMGDTLRSLGFGLGAAGGIFAEEAAVSFLTGGIGTMPTLAAQIGKLYKVGSGGKAAFNAAKTLNQLERVSQAVDATSRLTDIGRTVWSGKLGARNILSSLGEATFEAIETQKNLELDLIDKYRQKYGIDPDDETRAEIKKATIEAGNTRYLLNVGLLSITNAIEFDGLFKTFPVSKYFKNQSSKIATELGERGFQAVEKEVAEAATDAPWYKTFASKLNKANPGLKIVAPAEGFEEAAQMAFDEYTAYYAEHKYNGREESSGVMDATLHALKETFTTSEGWNAIIQGMVAGGIQQVGTEKITNYRNRNLPTRADITNTLLTSLNEDYTNQDGTTNYDAVKSLLNLDSLGGTAQAKVDHAASMAGVQKQAKRAIEGDNQRAFQDAKDELQFSFLNQFIQTNQYESLQDVLGAWQELAETDLDAFKKQFGLDNPQATAQTIADSISQLVSKGERLKEIYDNVDLTFTNRFKPRTPEYDQYNRYKTELTNQLFRYERFRERYEGLESKNQGFNHLLTAFNPQEFNDALKREKQGIETQLSIPSPEGSNVTFAQQERELKKRLDQVNDLLELSNKKITQEELKEIFFKTDDVFGTGSLRGRTDAETILNNIADMAMLQDNMESSVKLYQKLSNPKGFQEFKKVEVAAEEKAEEPRKKQRAEKKAKEDAIKEEVRKKETKQQLELNYANQLADVASVTKTSVEALTQEFINSGVAATQENLDAFILRKLNEANPVPTGTPQEVVASGENTDEEVFNFEDDGEGGFDLSEEETPAAQPVAQPVVTPTVQPTQPQTEDQSQGEEQTFVAEDDEFFIFEEEDEDVPVVQENPLQTYIDGTTPLKGKYIKYLSGSEGGTKDYRYINEVLRLDNGNLEAQVFEFENGKLVDKGNKKFNLNDPTKFTEVVDTVPKYDGLVRAFLAPPTTPPTPRPVSNFNRNTPIPLAYFQTFFVVNNAQRGAIVSVSNPNSYRINISTFPTKGSGAVIYNDGATTIRSRTSPKLEAGKGQVYSFELTADSGSLGIFRPLSSFEITRGGKTENIYDIVERSLTNPNELDKIKPYIQGTVQDLQTSFRIEQFLAQKAKNKAKSVTLNDLQQVLGRKVIFKPYFTGVKFSKTEDNTLVRLDNLIIDRTQSFIWDDRQRFIPFEGSGNVDYTEALQARSNLFTGDGFTQSTLSSYLLFFKDSTGSWNTLPIRTIPVTAPGQAIVVESIEQNIQSFEGTQEDLVKRLNDSFFFQNAVAKGNFVYSKGKIQFLLQSLFGDSISYKDPKANDKDSQQIRISVDLNPATFTIKGFQESIQEKVTSINKKGETDISFGLSDFRLQPISNPSSAEDFGQYRVMSNTRIPFENMSVNYQLSGETFEAPSVTPETVQEPKPEAQTKDQKTEEVKPTVVEETINPEVSPEPVKEFTYNADKMSKQDAENFLKTFPDEASRIRALRPDYKGKAKVALEQILNKSAETVDPTSIEGMTRMANQGLKGNDLFKNSDEEFVPSLKIDSSELDLLVQKALRECN